MKSNRFAIIDLETTGGKASRDRVTEIGIVIHDGNQILETFGSLINPECYIPAGIVELTGITQEMVTEAPKFYEIAKTVVELTQNSIFVAHNVRFDYTFLQQEFARLGYTFSRKKLCTVQLSRAVFPGLPSYSLGNLITHFSLNADRRHRALDDALATAELFGIILSQEHALHPAEEMINLGLKSSMLPEGWDPARILELPESCGVYYFHNKEGEVLYVGKSINIQKRIADHFRNPRTKGRIMQEQTDHITYEITGSELLALILESHEIKRLQPPINRAQKTRSYPYFIHKFRDEEGFERLEILRAGKKTPPSTDILGSYPKVSHARNHLTAVAEEHKLCLKKTGLESGVGACFNYHLGHCGGACIARETVESYNARVEAAIPALQKNFSDSFFILENGRTADEYVVIGVKKGVCIGYGYLEKSDYQGVSDLFDCLQRIEQTAEMTHIIRRYIGDHPKLKRVPVPEYHFL